jgi:hypothetical protein
MPGCNIEFYSCWKAWIKLCKINIQLLSISIPFVAGAAYITGAALIAAGNCKMEFFKLLKMYCSIYEVDIYMQLLIFFRLLVRAWFLLSPQCSSVVINWCFN